MKKVLKETLKKRKKRALKISNILKKEYSKARIVLKYSSPWELLVAVILSAQCTDKKVNQVTESLFKKYRTLEDYVSADPREFEKMIFSTGFYRAKTRNILAAAKLIHGKFSGQIPRTMQEILEVPGVARKTANVVLGNAYTIIEGIAVDTHVFRLSHRLGLSRGKNPVIVERDLMELIPRKEWFDTTYRFIELGRRICTAKKPACNLCPLRKHCPSAFQFPHFQKKDKK